MFIDANSIASFDLKPLKKIAWGTWSLYFDP